MSVHFLDSDGNEIEVTNPDCYPLSFNVTDSSIISVSMEEVMMITTMVMMTMVMTITT